VWYKHVVKCVSKRITGSNSRTECGYEVTGIILLKSYIYIYSLLKGVTCGGGGSARRKAITYTGQHNTEKRGHTSTPRVGLEPTIPVFERPKTVRASERLAIGPGET